MGSHGLFRSTALKSCGVVVGAFALTIPALPASASPGPAPSFQSAVNYPLDYEVHTVVSGDVNGDDIKDLVSLNQVDPGDPPISVQLGTGTGTFGSAHAYGTTLTGVASDIALADLDGNHHLDVVISEPEFIATIPGNGDGTFASTTEVGSTGVNTAIAIGDFDGVDGLTLWLPTTPLLASPWCLAWNCSSTTVPGLSRADRIHFRGRLEANIDRGRGPERRR